MTPRVLITNDDGVTAPGLRHLAAAVFDHGLPTVVAAPLNEASGSSAALTAVVEQGRVVVRQHQFAGLDGATGYGVGASPAYIVVLAMLGAFGPPPDVVLSGINRGANAGQAVLHSGTVGAALVAGHNGRRAMAVSLDVLSAAAADPASGGAAIASLDMIDDEIRNWATAAGQALALLPALCEAPPGTVLNLNVPDVPADQVRGLRRARLGRLGQTQMAIVEQGEGYVRTAVHTPGVERKPGTDVAYLADGYATVTALDVLAEDTALRLPTDAQRGRSTDAQRSGSNDAQRSGSTDAQRSGSTDAQRSGSTRPS